MNEKIEELWQLVQYVNNRTFFTVTTILDRPDQDWALCIRASTEILADPDDSDDIVFGTNNPTDCLCFLQGLITGDKVQRLAMKVCEN